MSNGVSIHTDKRATSRDLHNTRRYMPFVAPAMVVMVLLVAVPFIAVVLLSFTNYELAMPADSFKWIGLRNYDRLLFGTNKLLYYSLGISVGMMVVATVLQMLIGFFCASLLNRDIKFRGLAIACLLVPIAMTPSIASQIWKLMLNAEFGVINYFLKKLFNFSVVWLDKDNSLPSVLLVNIWSMTPYVTLTLYAGLRSLPLEPYESAVIDGANGRQVLMYVTLPMLKPLILLTLLFRSIDMLKMFDVPYVLTQGGPGNITEFIGLHIYRTGFGVTTLVGRASAISVILIVLVGIISLGMIKLMSSEEKG
ncbi:MAG: sugar ABC transporter permease [Clostridiales bacterium]|nr:sugar ABC transporter permease [Clostridiales bacterium]